MKALNLIIIFIVINIFGDQINMSEQEVQFSRAPPREGWTKAFAVDSERTRGHANKMLMNSYPEYKSAAQTYQVCMLYANSYANTMVLRVLEE